MAGLVALDLPGDSDFVAALQRIWDRGDAVLPVDQRLPPAARERLFAAMEPTTHWDTDGEHPRAGRPVEHGDALVMPTSGSTGDPKGVILTHDAVRASAVASSERIGVRSDDHWLACLPLAHVGGLSVVTKALTLGTRLTVQPGFDPVAVREAADSGATLVSLVPTALRRIDPSWFRCIVLGGSRPPADRPPHVLATYGMTETGSGVVYDGVPLSGVELRIADDGEVLLRGPMLLRGYRDGTTPVDTDGWLHTGDLGAIGPDGRLMVQGRRGDLIITGGENVWPETVESVLATHPDVADVAVVGAPDAEWGARVVAAVVPRDPHAPPTLESLRDHVSAQLPRFMAPRSLILVEAVPRTALGKIERHRVPLSETG